VSPALAQTTDDDRARMHFQAGTSYFDQGRYAESAQQFDDAYRLSQRPRLLANASLAYERAGNLARAIERLEAFLASGSAEANESRATQTVRLESLRTRLAAEASRTPVAPDAEPTSQETAAEPVAEAHDASGGGAGLRISGLTIGGVGIGLGVTALALGLKAHAIHGELADVCGVNGDECPPDRADDIDRGARLSTISTIAMVGSLASLATGTTLYLLGRARRSDGTQASAFLDVGPGRVGVTAFGSF
jgi:tetratricopeptide (TPR) repeat protein